MLKEILKNRGTWVVVLVILFSVFCFIEEDYTAPWFVVAHYVLLAAVWVGVVVYAGKKITSARKAAAEKFRSFFSRDFIS